MKRGSLLAIGLGILLLVYTASRSFEFLAMTLPADKQILAFAGLVALDGGVIIWMFAYLSPNLGTPQRWIAITLVVVDFLGSAVTFIADTLYNTGKVGLTFEMSGNDIWTVILIVSLIIAGNVAGAVAFHMMDPDAREKSAINDAHARIREEALRMIHAGTPELAAALAPQMAASILEEHAGNIRIQVSERKARTRKLASNLPAQSEGLPAQKRQLPARNETPGEEEETTQGGTRLLAQANPTLRQPVSRLPVNGNGKAH